MVAAERMRLAETEEELKEAQAEKDALRSALRLMEDQNITSGSAAGSGATSPDPRSPSAHAHKRSSSSAIAVKSLPASVSSSPRSARRISSELRAAVPPPLHLPEVGLAASQSMPNSAISTSPDELSPMPTPTPASAADHEEPAPATTDVSRSDSLTPPKTDAEQTPSPSPTPSPGQYKSARPPPISYFDGEESPWADARSQTPVTAGF